MTARDRGSTIPLILGFFLVGLIAVAGAVAAGDAFGQQRGLQDVCDGAAAAAAASAADLDRTVGVVTGDSLRFAGVERVVEAYLARDPQRRDVRVSATLARDARTLSLICRETRPIVFGTFFGKRAGVRHVARSSARAPVR